MQFELGQLSEHHNQVRTQWHSVEERGTAASGSTITDCAPQENSTDF